MVRSLVLSTLLCSLLVSSTPYPNPVDLTPAPAGPNSHARVYRREVELDDPAPSLVPVRQPSPPSAPEDVNDGVLICHTAHVSTSNPEFYMNRNEAATAISTFCGRIDPGVVFQSQGGTPFQNVQVDGPTNHTMAISAIWIGGENCPTMDFSNKTNVKVCQQRLLHDIVDQCNTAKNGLEYWKGGGIFTRDCITWTIQRVTSLW